MQTPMNSPLTIQIAGLGGQGVVLAGDILAEAALLSNLNVKKSEIHGLSRRFGSVSCQIRIGNELHSPLRGHGGVDLLLALEGYEGLKLLPFLAANGKGLFNRMWRKPGASSEPNDITPIFSDDRRIAWFEGTELMRQAESTQCLNFFMLGILGTKLPISEEAWFGAINGITTRGLETNLKMFSEGQRIAQFAAPRYRYHLVASRLNREIAS